MILDAFSLQGKVAIITGSGRGIGKGIALAFAEAGADIVCVGRTLSAIEATAAEARGFGHKALAIACDVTDSKQVEDMVARTIQDFGRIDILVNNAGGSTYLSGDEDQRKALGGRGPPEPDGGFLLHQGGSQAHAGAEVRLHHKHLLRGLADSSPRDGGLRGGQGRHQFHDQDHGLGTGAGYPRQLHPAGRHRDRGQRSRLWHR